MGVEQRPEHHNQSSLREDLSEAGQPSRSSPESQQGIKSDVSRWPETFRNPPLMGSSGEDVESPEAAREFFEYYLTREWNKRRDEKELSRTLKEVNRLRKLYPGLWEEVLEERLERIRKAWEEKHNKPW